MVSRRDREAVFHPRFIEDLIYFVGNERKLALKLLDMVQAIVRDPFAGAGKPEPLKGLGAGT